MQASRDVHVRGGGDRRRRLAYLTLVFLFCPAVPAAGQTALLIVENEPGLASEAFGEGLGAVAWQNGPVASTGLEETSVSRALASLAGEGAKAVIVVTLTRGDAGSWWAEVRDAVAVARQGDLESVLPAHVLVASPVDWSGGTEPWEVRRVAIRELDRLPPHVRGRGGDGAPQVFRVDGVNVTATRDAREVSSTPRAVTSIPAGLLTSRAPVSAMEPLTDIPGLDVTGVGGNQRRPVIRGLTGQRILLLEDGVRLNNPRRRQSSVEPPDIAGIHGLDRVEVVKGASSVLYGSDAIGGVVNLVTRRTRAGQPSATTGRAGLRWGSAGNHQQIWGSVSTSGPRFALDADGSYRDARAYDAPAGSFGLVSLSDPTRVWDTGVRDYTMRVRGDATVGDDRTVFASYRRYDAEDAGFGLVEPADLGEDGLAVRIRMPQQTVGRLVVGYEAVNLGSPVGDRLTLTAYRQANDRDFHTNVSGPLGPPGARLESHTENRSTSRTLGMRGEARKLLGRRNLLTYGFDLTRDEVTNADSTSRSVTGLGPPSTTANTLPALPRVTIRNFGAFVQDEVSIGTRVDLVLGLRYQDVHSESHQTPDWTEPLVDETERTGVGTANLLIHPAERWTLVASVGRGFRTPNAIERFFSGPTPEGRGFWIRNPDLRPETSLNVDLGARLGGERLSAELFIFQNDLHDGIRQEPTGDEIDGVAVLQNVNVEKLRFRGVEVSASVSIDNGVALEGSYTHLDAENLADSEDPVADVYRNKGTAGLVYAEPTGRFWAEYRLRFQGRRDQAGLGASPVGDAMPSFSVHALRGGIRILEGHRLGVAIENLSNALYAEAGNAGFFRPEPGRHVVFSWTAAFPG